MARKTPPNPFAAHVWFLEAGWVFMMHSAQLMTDPARAASRLAALTAEKQRAFAEGAVQASAALLRGARPDLIAQAALAPARRRVRANSRRILKSPG
jgi:hypothetical protein